MAICSINGYAQNFINEYSNFDCSQSKNLSIPLPKYAKALKGKNPKAFNQIVFYEHRDQFSYWYRLNVTGDRIISCNIKPINESDEYVLYIYKYKKADFCNKVFYGKIKPLKLSNFINGKNTEGKASEFSDVKMKVKKGEAYYFCVLNISASNCGHEMQLVDGKDTMNIKAIHYPCTEEEEAPVAIAQKETPKKVEAQPVVDVSRVYDTITVYTKAESIKNKNIDAFLTIKEELTGNEVEIITLNKYSYKIAIEKGVNYNVECLATGYKNFDHSMIISEYVHPDSNVFDLFLMPLKVGDNFVMKNIYFYPNTYALRRGSEKELRYLLNYLLNNPEVRIELQGYTNGDNRCKKNRAYRKKGPEWNFSGTAKKLSLYRSEAIKKHLVKNGVVKQNIETKGFGGERMIVRNPRTLEAIDKNIRVEVMILKASGL